MPRMIKKPGNRFKQLRDKISKYCRKYFESQKFDKLLKQNFIKSLQHAKY